jgi:hypothetical protein
LFGSGQIVLHFRLRMRALHHRPGLVSTTTWTFMAHNVDAK